MTIQVLPNGFRKIGLLLFSISFLAPFIAGFLNPCVSNEELSLLYPYDGLISFAFFSGILLFFISKKKGGRASLTT